MTDLKKQTKLHETFMNFPLHIRRRTRDIIQFQSSLRAEIDRFGFESKKSKTVYELKYFSY